MDIRALSRLVGSIRPDAVVHLAARAGVRESIDNATAYTEVNALGFARVLEVSRAFGVKRLVYASSSSVYGDTTARPTPETEPCVLPRSPYAATKLANELLAASLATEDFACVGLRLFTAYGPWGRPDMAAHFFLDALLKGNPIQLNNRGDMGRDWVYVEDVADVISFALSAPVDAHEIWNVGSGVCTPLTAFVDVLEALSGRTTERLLKPLPRGDVAYTQADLSRLAGRGAPVPKTSLSDGLAAFVRWHASYYGAA